MDWELAIEKNRTALTKIVAGLFVLVGWVYRTPSSSGLTRGSKAKPKESLSRHAIVSGDRSCVDARIKSEHDEMRVKPQDEEVAFLPRKTRNHLAAVLTAVESALRRLIVLFVRVHGIAASVRKASNNRPLPDFSTFGQGTSDRPPRFNLIDPRKSLAALLRQGEESSLLSASPSGSRPFTNCAGLSPKACSATEGGQSSFKPIPRIWTTDMPIPVKAPEPEPNPIPNSTSLLRRLKALDHALRTLPQQAKRLARIIEQRKHAPPGPKQYDPIRGGYPPGHRQKPVYDVDYILLECHGLVRDHEQLPP